MTGLIIAIFDWKERGDARKWVRRMHQRGLYTFMAETGRDQYELLATEHPKDIEWWRESMSDIIEVSIRSVTERLDE